MGEKKGKVSGLGIVGYDAYEFVVADVERSRRFYSEMMDVPEIARLDEREAARRGEDAILFGSAGHPPTVGSSATRMGCGSSVSGCVTSMRREVS